MESFSNLEKIVQDIRQDPMQSNKILQEFYGILISFWKRSYNIIEKII